MPAFAGMTIAYNAWLFAFAGMAFFLLFAPPARAEINIAAVGPMTGQDAPTGEQMQHGAEAAVEAINAAGGVHGAKTAS